MRNVIDDEQNLGSNYGSLYSVLKILRKVVDLYKLVSNKTAFNMTFLSTVPVNQRQDVFNYGSVISDPIRKI